MNGKRNAIGFHIILLLAIFLSLTINPDTAKADSPSNIYPSCES